MIKKFNCCFDSFLNFGKLLSDLVIEVVLATRLGTLQNGYDFRMSSILRVIFKKTHPEWVVADGDTSAIRLSWSKNF